MKYHGKSACDRRLEYCLRQIFILFIILGSYNISLAQVWQSPTPITVNLVTPTPFVNQQVIATVTPTFTATAKGPVLLEARESAGSVNVRAEPDPNGDRLGGIEFGTQYPVLRQYFAWYEFQYDLSPSGRAWVYGELVDIVGDVAEIEIIDTLDEPANSVDPNGQNTETAIAITSVPGGIETATADARVLSVPTAIQDSANQVIDLTPYPTYTYPPDIALSIPTDVARQAGRPTGNLPVGQAPPLFPILMLGGFGLVGLLVSSLRR